MSFTTVDTIERGKKVTGDVACARANLLPRKRRQIRLPASEPSATWEPRVRGTWARLFAQADGTHPLSGPNQTKPNQTKPKRTEPGTDDGRPKRGTRSTCALSLVFEFRFDFGFASKQKQQAGSKPRRGPRTREARTRRSCGWHRHRSQRKRRAKKKGGTGKKRR